MPRRSPSVSLVDPDLTSTTSEEDFEWGVATLLVDPLSGSSQTLCDPSQHPDSPKHPKAEEKKAPASVLSLTRGLRTSFTDLLPEGSTILPQDCTPAPLEETQLFIPTTTERDAGGDDVWETGDDELMFNNIPEEDATSMEGTTSECMQSEGLPLGPREERNCPVCEVLLGKVTDKVSDTFSMSIFLIVYCTTQQLDEHVSSCVESLGGVSTTTPPPAASTSTPPKPSILLTPIPPSQSTKPSPKSSSGNAFSALMSSRKENEAWKEADIAEDRSFRPTKANGGRRQAPFYKVLQGMPIAVDAFRYGAIPGVNAYFLTCVKIRLPISKTH